MIINGDANIEIKKIKDESIDIIIVDPPYGNIVDELWDNKNGISVDLLNEYFRVLKKEGCLYIFCGIGEKSNSLLENLIAISHTNFYFKDLITWKKQKGYGARKGWLYTREELIWCVKDKDSYFWNEDNQYNENEKRNYKRLIGKSWFKRFTNVWTDINEHLYENINKDRINGNWHKNLSKKYQSLHSTIKPVKIIDRIIRAHLKSDTVVLDTFGGSGTTAIAAIDNGVDYIIIEKELDYVKLINKRIKEHLIYKNKNNNELF